MVLVDNTPLERLLDTGREVKSSAGAVCDLVVFCIIQKEALLSKLRNYQQHCPRFIKTQSLTNTPTLSGNYQSISTQAPNSLLAVDMVLPRFAETLQKTPSTHPSFSLNLDSLGAVGTRLMNITSVISWELNRSFHKHVQFCF